ncbi:MAG: NAD(P)/FAD-dependent oxidoreductase [Candidatus Hodarchaeales archaeon]
MNFIVIGNGVTGFTAAQVLSKKAPKGSSIRSFTDEQFPYYYRPKLPEFLGNSEMVESDVFAKSLEWYRENNVDLHLEERVESIDAVNKEIRTRKGTFTYDRLLLATGADCFIPPIKGAELDNCFDLRTLKDAVQIRERLDKSSAIAIIGGGVLGLEIANACIERKVKTTVIEFFPYLLPRQLDEEGGSILKTILEKKGLRFHVGVQTRAILGKVAVEGVELKNSTVVDADMVIICTGIVPRTYLAKNAGMVVNRGIVVNDYLETSVEGIYAAGDVAEYQGRVYGLVMPGIEMARIAAANMIESRSKKYRGTKISSALKVTGLYLTSLGKIKTDEGKVLVEKKLLDREGWENNRSYHSRHEESNIKG